MAYIFINRKEKTNWKYILIIVILALAVSAETFYLLREEEKISQIQFPEKIVKDETLNWKTYQSSKGEFSIKCPPDFECSIGVDFLIDDGDYGRKDVILGNFFKKSPDRMKQDLIFVSIESWTEFGSFRNINNFEDWVKYHIETVQSEIDSQMKREDFVLDNNPAIKLSFVNWPYENWIGRRIFSQKGKRIFEIDAFINPEYQTTYLPIFDQMLSTFRFLE